MGVEVNIEDKVAVPVGEAGVGDRMVMEVLVGVVDKFEGVKERVGVKVFIGGSDVLVWVGAVEGVKVAVAVGVEVQAGGGVRVGTAETVAV